MSYISIYIYPFIPMDYFLLGIISEHDSTVYNKVNKEVSPTVF